LRHTVPSPLYISMVCIPSLVLFPFIEFPPNHCLQTTAPALLNYIDQLFPPPEPVLSRCWLAHYYRQISCFLLQNRFCHVAGWRTITDRSAVSFSRTGSVTLLAGAQLQTDQLFPSPEPVLSRCWLAHYYRWISCFLLQNRFCHVAGWRIFPIVCGLRTASIPMSERNFIVNISITIFLVSLNESEENKLSS
jgi:hypothetical protein